MSLCKHWWKHASDPETIKTRGIPVPHPVHAVRGRKKLCYFHPYADNVEGGSLRVVLLVLALLGLYGSIFVFGGETSPKIVMMNSIAKTALHPAVFVPLLMMLVLWAVIAKIIPSWNKEFEKDPGFAAHQVVCMPALVFLGFFGAYGWFEHFAISESTQQQRMTDVDIDGQFCARVMYAFQVWDLIVCTAVKSLCVPLMLLHHVTVIAVTGLLVHYQKYMYYSCFFFGFIETSSVPLVIVDMFHPNHFGDLGKPDAEFGQLNEVSRIVFAVLYLLIRFFYWPFVMFNLLSDLWGGLAPDAQGAPPASTIWTTILVSIFLTGLQMYWAVLILKQVVKLFTGEEDEDED
jgi:hypothetical protein